MRWICWLPPGWRDSSCCSPETMTDPRGAAARPIVILVNPASTAAHPGLVDHAERVLGPLGLRAVLTTEARGHAAELARGAVETHGALTLVTIGGDGTAAEAAGALIGTGSALAPMPAGSTNVFARTLGWPRDCEMALDELAGDIARGTRPDRVTIGHVSADGDDRIFIVNAGAGIDAEAAETVERHPDMKRHIGQAWFAGATAMAALRTRKGDGVVVSIDGGAPFRLASLSVACSRPFAFFGDRPFDLIPEAGEEGALGWLGSATGGVIGPAVAVAGALTGAWHLDSSKVAHGVAHERITMESDEGVALQADGEPLGRFHHAVFTPAAGLLVMRPGGGSDTARD